MGQQEMTPSILARVSGKATSHSRVLLPITKAVASFRKMSTAKVKGSLQVNSHTEVSHSKVLLKI